MVSVDLIMIACISIVGFSLLVMIPRVRSPYSIILMADTAVLILIQFLLLKRADDKHKIIEKSNTILEWTVPRKTWHITEARRFSPLILALWFIIGFIVFFLMIAVPYKLRPPDHINENTLTLAGLLALSAGLAVLFVALYGSLWWWARLKVKLTISGIKRIFHNSTRTWKYDRIKCYNFETLRSETGVYTLVVLRNHKGKTWKIALDESVNNSKIEEILNEHGIQKI